MAKSTLGARLKKARKDRGLSLYRAAIDLDVERSTVKRWEDGVMEPGNDRIAALAAYYGVRASWLAFGERVR